MKSLGKSISTVGDLRAALEQVPDNALLNIGTDSYGFSVDDIHYDGLSVALETKEDGIFAPITDAKLKAAMQCLINNGIEEGDAETVLQALGYVLLDAELFPDANHLILHKAELPIDQSRLDYIKELLSLTGPEIYERYGLKRDETLTNTIHFDNGYEIDVKVVICEEDTPYIDIVLFNADGCEIACDTGDGITIEGEFSFQTDTSVYLATIKAAERVIDQPVPALDSMIQQATSRRTVQDQINVPSTKTPDLIH